VKILLCLLPFNIKRILKRYGNYFIAILISIWFSVFNVMSLTYGPIKNEYPSNPVVLSFIFLTILVNIVSFSGMEFKRKGLLETLLSGPVSIQNIFWAHIIAGIIPAYLLLLVLWVFNVYVVLTFFPGINISWLLLMRVFINAPLASLILQMLITIVWLNIKDERTANIITIVTLYPIFYFYFRYFKSYDLLWILELLFLLVIFFITNTLSLLITKKESIVLKF